eukprot:Skav212512  [mRNA]  locus=scaffold2713:163501:163770:- [translate_table: standard]
MTKLGPSLYQASTLAPPSWRLEQHPQQLQSEAIEAATRCLATTEDDEKDLSCDAWELPMEHPSWSSLVARASMGRTNPKPGQTRGFSVG